MEIKLSLCLYTFYFFKKGSPSVNINTPMEETRTEKINLLAVMLIFAIFYKAALTAKSVVKIFLSFLLTQLLSKL